MFILMRAIGELMYNDPSQHTFTNFITNMWAKAVIFQQWSYWIVLVLIGMTELLTAVSKYFVEFPDVQ